VFFSFFFCSITIHGLRENVDVGHVLQRLWPPARKGFLDGLLHVPGVVLCVGEIGKGRDQTEKKRCAHILSFLSWLGAYRA
jgi:hypothetical protein